MTTTVRIPSVAQTIRTYVMRSLLGGSTPSRALLGWFAVVVLFILVIPRLDSTDSPSLIFLPVLVTVSAAIEARREYLFGGPHRLVVAAGVTAFIVYSAMVATIVAVSIVFGPEPDSSPIDSVPGDLIVVGLVAFLVVLPILYWVRKPARERQEAAFRAEVRAERTARGRPVRI